MKQNAVNAITLQACLNQKMNQGRRDAIVNTLPDHFKPPRKIPDTNKELFGEDLVPKLADLKKTSNLLKVKSNNYRQRSHPYSKSSSSYSSKAQYHQKQNLNYKSFNNKNAPGKGNQKGQQDKHYKK